MRTFHFIRTNLELRPRVDLGGCREQQAAAGLLRVGLGRACIDNHLAVEYDAARAAGDGPRRLPAAGLARAMSCDIHAVHVARLMSDQERIGIQMGSGLAQIRFERGAHQAAAERDG